jgi:hypothetical protein
MVRMTGSARLLAVVVFLVALGVGVLATSLMVGGIGGSASPSPSLAGQASSAPTTASASGVATASAVASGSPSAGASAPASDEPTPSTEPTTKPTTAPGIPAAITFSALKLDAAEDPDGRNRVITFSAQGAGTVSARLTSVSPRGETRICLRSAKKDFGCKTTADGTLSAKASASELGFTVTLRGVGIAAPIVELALTFPATRPAVTIDNARFDGTGFPETNGIDVVLAPRTDGNVRVIATWGGHPLVYDLVLKERGGSGAHELDEQGPSTGTNTRLPVTAPNPWRLVLRNAEEGFGATPLTARISWP